MGRRRESGKGNEAGTRGRGTGMMKSSFILYIVCMKILDPRESPLLRQGRERRRESGGEKDTQRDSPRGSLHSLWIRIAAGPRNRDISTVALGLHRVKLTGLGAKEASETFLTRVFCSETDRARCKMYVRVRYVFFLL